MFRRNHARKLARYADVDVALEPAFALHERPSFRLAQLQIHTTIRTRARSEDIVSTQSEELVSQHFELTPRHVDESPATVLTRKRVKPASFHVEQE